MRFLVLLSLAMVSFGQNYNRMEAVYNFTANRGWNFGELQMAVPVSGKTIVLGGDYFGFHHGGVGMIRVGVPKKIKGVPIILSALGVFGTHENGPGVGVRWEWEKGRFYTQGLLGVYRPVHRSGLGMQYIADPLEVGYRPLPRKFQNVQAIYSFEGGRYGLYGSLKDTFHSVGISHPIKKIEVFGSYVLGHEKIVRFGVLFRPGNNKENKN